MPTYDPFNIRGGTTATATKGSTSSNFIGGTPKSNVGRTYDPFGINQSTLHTPTASATNNSSPKNQNNKPAGSSLFSKVKNVVKGAASDAKTTLVDKPLNTLAAGASGVIGLGEAGVQAATGNKKGEKTTLTATQEAANQFLDKGVGGKGGFLNSKQAASRGTGGKGYVNDFVKPTAQGATDVLPYVFPAGKAAKGASLLVRAGKSAASNALVSGGTTAANEAIQGNITKDGGKEIAKSVALGAALGAGGSLLHGAAKEGVARVSTKEASSALNNAKTNTLLNAADKSTEPATVYNPSNPKVKELVEARQNEAQSQAAPDQAADKQRADAVATAEKNQEQGKKVDRQIELIQAKGKDSETGLSNVDKTKLNHLQEDKQQLEDNTKQTLAATVTPTEQAASPIEHVATPVPDSSIPKEAPEPQPQQDRGVSKVAQSVQEKAVARGLKNDFGGPGGYDKVTIADQAAKATKVANDRPLLDSIINGDKPLPDGLRATALIKAVEEHPVLGKDPELINRLSQAEHLTGESSRSAQELRLAAERSPTSPVEAVRQVRQARAEAVERK